MYEGKLTLMERENVQGMETPSLSPLRNLNSSSISISNTALLNFNKVGGVASNYKTSGTGMSLLILWVLADIHD